MQGCLRREAMTTIRQGISEVRVAKMPQAKVATPPQLRASRKPEIGESDRTTMGQGHTTSEVFGYLSGARVVHLSRVGYSLDLAWPSPALHHPSCAPCTPALCANPFILLEIVRAAAIRRPKETHLGFPPPLSPSCCFHMSSCLSFCC